MNYKKGFTLIELLVVVAIIGILASVILVAVSSARSKGNDAAVKSNLRNAMAQAEVFYNTNTSARNAYTSVCTNGVVGGANGVGVFVLNAAKAAGLASYGGINIGAGSVGSVGTATCNDSAGAWATEVPLSTATYMWCVDSAGKSKQEINVSIGGGTVCS